MEVPALGKQISAEHDEPEGPKSLTNLLQRLQFIACASSLLCERQLSPKRSVRKAFVIFYGQG